MSFSKAGGGMHKTSHVKVDGLQPQKTITGSRPVSQAQESEAIMAVYSHKWRCRALSLLLVLHVNKIEAQHRGLCVDHDGEKTY